MKKISKEELKKILNEHKLWLESNGKKGKQADLSHVNLSHVDLSHADLSYIDLSNANLSNMDLTNANLFYANLSDANLSYVDLSNANLSNVNLSHAGLFYTDLSNTDLSGVDLSNTNLSYVNLSFANLSFANLFQTDLTNANLSNAKLIKVADQNVKGKKIIAAQVDTSRKNNLISYWADLDIWTTGCFQGTLEELKKAIEETHKDNQSMKRKYFIAINFILSEVKEDKKKG